MHHEHRGQHQRRAGTGARQVVAIDPANAVGIQHEKPGCACPEPELRAFAQAELGKYKSPKLLRFVEDLPRGPSGKVQRLKLIEFAG